MVCNRCIMMVKSELEKFGLQPGAVTLGEIDLPQEISEKEKQLLNFRFQELGFEIIDDRKTQLVERIKTCIVERIHHSKEPLKETFSEYLSKRFHKDYSALSKFFSEVQGVTIEQYAILQRIERVKELLVYDELSLSQIAFQLNYSSVSHLSKQFKKVTGTTPTRFKKLPHLVRMPLDEL
jgi:AraC family transcriptional regulator